MPKYSCKFQEEKIAPKPYVYEYGGVDASGLAAAKTESQDADGTVHGKNNQKIHSCCCCFPQAPFRVRMFPSQPGYHPTAQRTMAS